MLRTERDLGEGPFSPHSLMQSHDNNIPLLKAELSHKFKSFGLLNNYLSSIPHSLLSSYSFWLLLRVLILLNARHLAKFFTFSILFNIPKNLQDEFPYSYFIDEQTNLEDISLINVTQATVAEPQSEAQKQNWNP